VNVLKLDNIVLNKEDYNFYLYWCTGNELNVFKGGENNSVIYWCYFDWSYFIEYMKIVVWFEQLDNF